MTFFWNTTYSIKTFEQLSNYTQKQTQRWEANVKYSWRRSSTMCKSHVN